MKDSLRPAFERLEFRLAELDALMADPALAQDPRRYRQVSREHADCTEVLGLYRRHTQQSVQMADTQALLDSLQDAADASDDDALRTLAEEDLQGLQSSQAALAVALERALLPKDPLDERAAFLEVRAGTGGDESALFAADLVRMYCRYADRQGWQVEVLSESPSDLGGFKSWIGCLRGHQVYGTLKFESGGHRVQRIPATETQGRIHTSACTVAVLPEPDEAEAITLHPADLRIDTFRASGAGGQHINKTDSAIRVTHLPTGLVAECQDDRSQHRNKAKALAVLQARLEDRERQARHSAEAATRKALVGSGDRSDRIRTYNFPQGRVSDHRIHLTLHRLSAVLDGDLSELSQALIDAQVAEQLAELERGTAPP